MQENVPKNVQHLVRKEAVRMENVPKHAKMATKPAAKVLTNRIHVAQKCKNL